jgi:hypothetical protein
VPDPLADIDDEMTAHDRWFPPGRYDQMVKRLVTAVRVFVPRVKALEDRADAVEARVTALETRVTALGGRAGSEGAVGE